MTEEQLQKGQELLESIEKIKEEIKDFDKEYALCINNNDYVRITFNRRNTHAPNKNRKEFTTTMYNVLRNEFEKELIELQKEFEQL